MPEADEQLGAFFKAQLHNMGSKWRNAVEICTRGLECDSRPSVFGVGLYFNRALAHFNQGTLGEAGQDVRRGLALYDVVLVSNPLEDLRLRPLLDELKPLLDHLEFKIADEVGTRDAMEHARSGKEEGSVAPSIITPDSPLGSALQDRESTAYFYEAQFRALHPGSKQRFLATTGLYNCIAVFASSVGGRAFGAHIDQEALHSSLYDINVRGQGGMILENMSRAMQRVFRDVDNTRVTISLVGGWKKADFVKDLQETYFPEEEDMWHFSAVVRRCVEEALPGASIDTSRLNVFDGLEFDQCTTRNKFRCTRQGQAFRVVVLLSNTGRIETQTTDETDLTAEFGPTGPQVPISVLRAGYRHLTQLRGRVRKQIPGKEQRRELSPIMTEYTE